MHLLVISQRYYKMLGPTIKRKENPHTHRSNINDHLGGKTLITNKIYNVEF
jgi:hypothetical protein